MSSFKDANRANSIATTPPALSLHSSSIATIAHNPLAKFLSLSTLSLVLCSQLYADSISSIFTIKSETKLDMYEEYDKSSAIIQLNPKSYSYDITMLRNPRVTGGNSPLLAYIYINSATGDSQTLSDNKFTMLGGILMGVKVASGSNNNLTLKIMSQLSKAVL